MPMKDMIMSQLEIPHHFFLKICFYSKRICNLPSQLQRPLKKKMFHKLILMSLFFNDTGLANVKKKVLLFLCELTHENFKKRLMHSSIEKCDSENSSKGKIRSNQQLPCLGEKCYQCVYLPHKSVIPSDFQIRG